MMRLVLLLVALLLVGCSNTSTPPAAPTELPEPPALNLHIEKLNIDTSMVEMRRDSAGVLEVPPVERPHVVGWYADGVVPGDVGPALVAGHVSGRPEGSERSVPGVFAELHTLVEGDEIIVERDGRPLRFVVYAVETVSKAEFPTERVYGDRPGAELVAVTCGGHFDPAARSYDENVIVFARQVS